MPLLASPPDWLRGVMETPMPARDSAQLILEVDARIATAQRAVNQLAQSIQKDAAGMDGSLAKVEKAQERLGRTMSESNGRIRSGMTQLSFQIGDVSQQMAMGVSASRVFAQQSGQVIQALQVMGGEGNKFLRFMGGPWGMAIATAAVVLGPLASKLFETGDEVGKLVDKMREQAKQAQLNEQANAIWERSLDGLIEKTRKLRDESTKALQTERDLARTKLDDAKGTLSQAERERDRIGRQLENARRQLREARAALVAAQAFAATAGPEQAGEAAAGLSGAQQRVGSAERSVKRLVGDLQTATAAAQNASTAVDNLGVSVARVEAAAMADPIKSRFKALREEAERTIKDVDRLSKRLAELDRQEEAAQQKAAATKRTGGGPASGLAQFIRPSDGPVTSGFGRRTGPTKGASTTHQAIDFGGNIGDPIKAAADGVVIHVGKLGGYGNAIIVDHGGGTITQYGHLSKILVSKGQTVGKKELIGEMGQSGIATGPNLDFKVKAGGKWVDPNKHGWKFPVDDTAVALKAARSGESDADKELRRRNDFEQQLEGLNQELLRAKGAVVQGVEAEADFAVEMAQIEQRRRDDGYQRDVTEKKLTQAEAEQLKAKNAQVAYEKIKAIETGRQLEKMRQASEAEQRIFEYRIDDMRFADEMATTQAEHRRLQLDILDITYQQKEEALRKLIADKEKARNAKNSADIDRDVAGLQTQIDRLPTEKGQDRTRVMRGTMNPLEAWKRTVPQTAAEITEAMQRIQVEGLDSLASAITNVITGTQSLGEAFGDVARSIIADIVQMTVRMLIFRAISGIMGGMFRGGGGPLPGGLSDGSNALYGNVIPFARGGVVRGPTLFPMRDGRTGLMGEAGPEAIMPLARDSMGRLGVRAANAAANNNQSGPIEVLVRFAPSPEFMPIVESVSANAVGRAAPVIVKTAVDQTMRAATRPALMGRR